MTLALQDRPQICPGMRLQWEAAQGAHVLLYAEGMVKLNQSAGEILSRCEGVLTTAEIIAELERAFAREDLTSEVLRFLEHAAGQRWIEVRA